MRLNWIIFLRAASCANLLVCKCEKQTIGVTCEGCSCMDSIRFLFYFFLFFFGGGGVGRRLVGNFKLTFVRPFAIHP